VDVQAGLPTTVIADVTAVTDWSPHLEDVEAAVHFAALHMPHRESHSREAFIDTNVNATQRLLAATKAAGVQRFVLASPTSVYGRSMRTPGRAAWVTEDLVPEPGFHPLLKVSSGAREGYGQPPGLSPRHEAPTLSPRRVAVGVPLRSGGLPASLHLLYAFQ